MTGDLDRLLGMLAEDVVVWSDGGGKRQAARRPIAGRDKAARFLIGIAEKGGPGRAGRHGQRTARAGLGQNGSVHTPSRWTCSRHRPSASADRQPDELQHLQPQA